MTSLNTLAFDLGAESGRAILGRFDGKHIALEEIHRFANHPVRVRDSLHWDVLRLWSEIKHSLSLAAPHHPQSIGIDTWGVDFGLLDRDDQLIGNPIHYRDHRTDGMMERAFNAVPRAEIFEQTGIQFMQINTLYQLFAMSCAQSPALSAARKLLLMPDLFNFWLTGRAVAEFTIASTTQCYNPREKSWATRLLDRLNIPSHIFQEIIPPASVLGPLTDSIADETGIRAEVIASAGHDTAAAVAAVPAHTPDFAYLSSGTWSLMGVETREPIITAASLAHNFTNEGGLGGTFRYLKNIMGLWLVQECRRVWSLQGEEFSYEDLVQLASQARPFAALIDPDDARFLHPDDMPAEIRAACAASGQVAPQDKGAIVRCVFASLALKYRWTLERIEETLGRKLSAIHIVGGGSQNALLCQWTADVTHRPVIAGPVEATTLGNMIAQLIALGRLRSVDEGRELVRQSFGIVTYEPHAADGWDEAYERWRAIFATVERD